ncbi:MAG: SCO family protein [Bacteroidales bacterium]
MNQLNQLPGVRAMVGALLFVLSTACGTPTRGHEYDLRGQILAVDRAERTVTIRHDDIKGFMPAMTMPFKVKDASLLNGRKRGELVVGKLLVTDTDAYLVSLEVVGYAEVAPVSAAVRMPQADILPPGAVVPDVRLIDTTGRALPLSSLRGSVVALTFIYTRCPLPQFCPLMDRQFHEVARQVAEISSLSGSVRLLSISFDPEYDTPAVLAAHARSVGADGRLWQFATADRPTIDAWAPRFGVVLVRGDTSTITHTLRTAIVDREGRLVRIYDGSDWKPEELVEALRKVAMGS